MFVVLGVIGSFIDPDPDSEEAQPPSTTGQAETAGATAAATTTVASAVNEPDETRSATASTQATTTAAEPASETAAAGAEATSEQTTTAATTLTSSSSGEASLQLQVTTEHDPGYDRDDWGPHNSSICSGAVGSPDPYTGTPIDTCHVDHVVALDEAHESGGWEWSAARKQQFSQDPANHVASRACVNQSKGGDDTYEVVGRLHSVVIGVRRRVHRHRSRKVLPHSDHRGCQGGVGSNR